MDVKIGDVVQVRMKVKEVTPTGKYDCDSICSLRQYFVESEDIFHVEPRSFAIGDYVKHDTDVKGTIIGVDNDVFWVKPSNGIRFVSHRSFLTRIDEPSK